MTKSRLGILATAVVLIAWQLIIQAQHPAKDSGRFEFTVTEVVDAMYLGDTPAISGRVGGVTIRPNLALGDPVYHDGRVVGRLTGIEWDRARESLKVEFDPEPYAQVKIGDQLSVQLGKREPGGAATK